MVRFLQRVWRLVLESESAQKTGGSADATALRRKVHQTIRKVTEDYEGFRFNTAVAALMELTNSLQDYLQAGGEKSAGWEEATRTLVLLLNPLAPHIAEEMWAEIGTGGLAADASWPEYDAQAAAEPMVTLVVQVAGTLRDRIEVPAGLSQEQALELALASERVRRHLDGERPSKVFYVPDRLINLVP